MTPTIPLVTESVPFTPPPPSYPMVQLPKQIKITSIHVTDTIPPSFIGNEHVHQTPHTQCMYMHVHVYACTYVYACMCRGVGAKPQCLYESANPQCINV